MSHGTGDARGEPVEDQLRRWIGLDAATVGPASLQRAAQARIQALGLDSPAALAARIRDDPAERDLLVEEVVVGESWFFRDPQVFSFLAEFATTLVRLPGRSPIRILSAPCAGGEEPYSAAMALLDAGLKPAEFTIDAVDVSRAALGRAARGRYSANAFRNADLSFRDRWFHPDGGSAVIDDVVRACVRFSWANVVDPGFAAGRGPYDFIFCRNMLIYLTTEARRRVEDVLDGMLAPDGILVLGAAEPPILKGHWVPAAPLSVFAMRHGTRSFHEPPSGKTVPSRAGPSRVAAREPPAPPPANAPTYVLEDVLREAESLANARRLAEALDLCERARRALPPSPELFFLMGMLHQSTGDLDRAEGCLHKTLYLDADHEEALLALALIATRRGEARMAETYRQSAARVLARKAPS